MIKQFYLNKWKVNLFKIELMFLKYLTNFITIILYLVFKVKN